MELFVVLRAKLNIFREQARGCFDAQYSRLAELYYTRQKRLRALKIFKLWENILGPSPATT